MGDIAFRRFISVNNAHDLYWKESKNFADGSLTTLAKHHLCHKLRKSAGLLSDFC